MQKILAAVLAYLKLPLSMHLKQIGHTHRPLHNEVCSVISNFFFLSNSKNKLLASIWLHQEDEG